MLELKFHNQKDEEKRNLEQFMEEHRELLKQAQAGEDCYQDSQGWLDVEEWAGEETLTALENLAEEIRQNGEVFVLIGVGGSNNAARSVIEALKQENGPKIVYAGNTLSPWAMQQMLKELEGKSVYIDCIAKNFETLEPGASFRILRKYLYEKYGEEASKRIIATGTKGSSLEQICKDKGYRFLEFPLNIGGRYTAISNVGLLPMAVAGVDIRSVVRGAADMQNQLQKAPYEENLAYRYACLRNILYKKGYRVEMLASFEPRFRWFYKWWIQLFAESEGKDNKGILPMAGEFSEELHSVGQYIQDGTPMMLETFLDVKNQQDSLIVEKDFVEDFFGYLDGKDFRDINRAAYQATVAAHSEKLPCLTLELDSLDAYHFGQLFYFFQFACYLSCKIMGVNAFDQPGVEAYKAYMFKALGKIKE